MTSTDMRNFALEYFQTHPSFQLNNACSVGGVREHVLKSWLDGKELDDIQRELLHTPLMVESVLKFKKYFVAIACSPIDIDGMEYTRAICLAFLDYIADVYTECETVISY